MDSLGFNELQKDVGHRAAELFWGFMDSDPDRPLDLEFTVYGTTPDDSLQVTCKAYDRDTREVVHDLKTETMAGSAGNIEMILSLTAAVCTGLAMEELGAKLVPDFGA